MTRVTRETRRAWPTREEWAANYVKVYADELDGVAATVSRRLADYATDEQVSAAVAELRACHTILGRQVRQATGAARAVLPGYGKPRRAADGLAYVEALNRLTRAGMALVNAADELRDRRHHAGRLARELDQGHLPDVFTRSRAGAVEAPTYLGIIGRYQEAVEQARSEFIRTRTSRVPDDAAWRRELERRAEIGRYFRDGPLIHRVGG